MTTRARANRGERRSWREQDAPISRPLLYYRRLAATLACILLVAVFAYLIYRLIPRSESWTSQHLFVAEYDRDSAPALPFAEREKETLQKARPRSKDVVQAGTDASNLPTALSRISDGNGAGQGPLLIQVAGHGCSVGEDAYLLASDCDPRDSKELGIHVRDLLQAVVQHPSRRALLIIDSGPIEHDLRIGTAVNRFPELLQAVVEKLELADDEELIVLSSHELWERSFVSPAERWSVFGFYVDEALTNPAINDGKLTLPKFAEHVQRRVSAWVWEASQQTRTQRPILLYARGKESRKIDFTSGAGRTKDFDLIKEQLDLIILPNLVAAQADGALALQGPWESAAYAQEPAADPAKAAAAQSDAAGKPADPPVPAAAAATSDKPPAPVEPSPPPAPDLRPDWLQFDAAQLSKCFGNWSSEGSSQWTLSDNDPQRVRRALRDALHTQQSRLAGGTRNSQPIGDNPPPDWNPLAPWTQNPQTLSDLQGAARIRNAALLRLPIYVCTLEAAEAQTHNNVQVLEDLKSMWTDAVKAVEQLTESMEQEAYVDSRAPDSQTIDAASDSATSSVKTIAVRANVLRVACTKLEERLQQLLLPAAPGDHWFPRWDLTQGVPLAMWDNRHWSTFENGPGLPTLSSVPTAAADKPAEAADKKLPPATDKSPSAPLALPSLTDIEEIERELRQRRMRWLERQTTLARLLPTKTASGQAIAMPGSSDRELNKTASEVAARHREAVDLLTSNLSSAAGQLTTQDHWHADRALRLALGAEAQQAEFVRWPRPLNHVQQTAQEFVLRLEGPIGPVPLALEKETAVTWNIRRGSSQILDLTHARLRLTFDNSLHVRHESLGAIQADREYPFKTLANASEDSLNLLVTPAREMTREEALQPGTTIKPLSLVLNLDPLATSRPARFDAQFQLPAAPVLDVIVAGYLGTMRLADYDPLGDGKSQSFWLNPPRKQSTPAREGADRRVVRLDLRPMPLGETRYQLSVMNRSTQPREVVAQWHVLEDSQPTAIWQTVERQLGDTSRRHRAGPILLQPGQPWVIPLFPEPMMPATGAQPAAAAPPAPAAPKPLLIGSGLVCELTDVKNSQWKQWIWIQAVPRHPATYVETDRPIYQLREGRGNVEVQLRAAPQSIDILPTGRTTLVRGNLESANDSRRVVFPTKLVPGQLAAGPLAFAVVIPPGEMDASTVVPFNLDVDGYSRALRFVVDEATRQVVRDQSGAIHMRLLEVADPPMPEKQDTPLARSQLYFQKAPKLRYQVQAEFPQEAHPYAVRVVQDERGTAPLGLFYFDRALRIELRPPPEEAKDWNLTASCSIQELSGELDWLTPDNYKPPARVKLRAEIVRLDDRGVFQPLQVPIRDDLEIVLDNQPPVLTQNPPEKVELNKTQPIPPIEFSVSDGEDDDEASGIRDVLWGTAKKGEDDLEDGQIPSITKGADGSSSKVKITIPKELRPAEDQSVEILLLIRDRAGNRFGPKRIQTIKTLKAKPKIDIPKGADKAAPK